MYSGPKGHGHCVQVGNITDCRGYLWCVTPGRCLCQSLKAAVVVDHTTTVIVVVVVGVVVAMPELANALGAMAVSEEEISASPSTP